MVKGDIVKIKFLTKSGIDKCVLVESSLKVVVKIKGQKPIIFHTLGPFSQITTSKYRHPHRTPQPVIYFREKGDPESRIEGDEVDILGTITVEVSGGKKIILEGESIGVIFSPTYMDSYDSSSD